MQDDPKSGPPMDEAKVDEIFDRALDLTSAARRSFLDHACGGETKLRARVERLLALSENLPSGLETAGAGELMEDGDLRHGSGSDGSLPARIGPYRILAELGRGGMGVVYLGERDDGHFQQRVAVKVMRPGSDTPEARRRFEQERQIIASLQHSNIARLYDGGVTDDGRPFSAMEHVEGRPIHAYCDDRRLGVEERLRLVEVVAGAVHYAHQKLVVHRDLKPSNILVTDDGQIKLLDFGIAKLLDATGADYLQMTRTGALPVTPLYASPEQLQGEAVTTASDIYQIGLLLFELLTGEKARRSSATPGSGPGFGMAPDVLPSAAVEGMAGEQAEEVARARGTSPRSLVRCLRRDLDAVVRAAMHPEPERRYPSAGELMEDLRRYRRREPLSVRPASVGYRAGLFVRRNRLGASLAALFVLLLVGYSITVTAQARRIARERDRAERIKDFALGLYGASDPNEALGPEVSAVELVARGVERAEDELAGEPDVQAEIKTYFAKVYKRLGRFDDAESLYREVLQLRREINGEVHPDVAEAIYDLGLLLLERDDPEALELLEAALRQRRSLFGDDHEATAHSLFGLSRYQYSIEDLSSAEASASRSSEILCGADPRSEDCSMVSSLLGGILIAMDRPAEGATLLRKSLSINQELFGEIHPEVATGWNNLAFTLWRMERWAEGDEAMARSLDIMAGLYGDEHPDIAASLGSLGVSLLLRGDHEAAIEPLEQSIQMREAVLGPRHVRVADVVAELARALAAAGRPEEAKLQFETALSIFSEHFPEDHPRLAWLWRGIGTMHLKLGELADARRSLGRSREIYAGMEGSKWPWRIDVWLARIDRLEGHPDAARKRLDAAEENLDGDEEWQERIAEERSILLGTTAEPGGP